MKIPNFGLKETVKDGVVTPPESNQETVLNLITLAVSDTYSEEKNGQKVSTLNGSLGRIWGRIQRKLDNAVEEKSAEITLETAEVDFIKKAMEKANFPILWFKYTVLIEEALENSKD